MATHNHTPIPPATLAEPPAALAAMLAELALLTAPAIPVFPEPDDFEAVAAHLLSLSDTVDRYIAAVGAHVADNASMGADQRLFQAQLRGALEGNALWELEQVGAALREDRYGEFAR